MVQNATKQDRLCIGCAWMNADMLWWMRMDELVCMGMGATQNKAK